MRPTAVLIAGLILAGTASCSLLHHKKVTAKDPVFYPSAPDTARIQYLATINGSDYLPRRSKFSTFVLGQEARNFVGKPFGAIMRNGKMYICDVGLEMIEIVDLKKQKWINFSPSGAGALKNPLAVAVDSNETMYIGDVGRHEVLMFDSARHFVKAVKDTGDFKPTDIVISGNELWVTNPVNHKINIYNKKTLELVNTMGQYEQGDDGHLYSPYNLFVDDERVYVTDFGDFKIKIFDKAGKYLSSVGSYGTSVGQFVRPKGIACDRDENLFVVDAGFENVQIFNRDGRLLMFFGGTYKDHGDMWLPQRVTVDYDNLKYFAPYVDPAFELKYLIIVCNQFGPDKVNIYGAISPRK